MFEQFKFVDFVSTEELTADVDAVLNWLLDLVPCDSRVDAVLRKIGNKFLCRIDISTSVQEFRGESLANSPKDAAEVAVAQLEAGIRRWRARHRPTEGVPLNLAVGE